MSSSPICSGPRDVHTNMNFYVPIGDEAPYQFVFIPPEGRPHNNLGSESRPITVHDVRGHEQDYTLDEHGFQFVHWPSTEREFVDLETIQTRYYAEVEELLKAVTGAKRIFIFDHTMRRSAKTETLDNLGSRGPVERVHVDQTYDAGIARVRRHFPDEAGRLLASRVRIINVWRPIQHVVAHKPLAMADWRTVDPDDLISVQLIYPDRTGSTFSVRYNQHMRFHYMSDQSPDEVVLLKIFDSEEDGRARLTPHSAFTDGNAAKEAPTRQSIEVRALVFDAED